jgi:hypothetical protein
MHLWNSSNHIIIINFLTKEQSDQMHFQIAGFLETHSGARGFVPRAVEIMVVLIK